MATAVLPFSDAAERYAGREIVVTRLSYDDLTLTLAGGNVLRIFDCAETPYGEEHYFTGDIARLVGKPLTSLTMRPASRLAGNKFRQVHDVMTLTIGTVTFTAHNEHNGDFPGFRFRADIEESDAKPRRDAKAPARRSTRRR